MSEDPDNIFALDIGAITDSILEDVTKDFDAFEKVVKFVLSTPEGAALKARFAAGGMTQPDYLQAIMEIARTRAGR